MIKNPVNSPARSLKVGVVAALGLALIAHASVASATTPRERCVKDKLRQASSHGKSVAKCYAKAAKKGDTSVITGCVARADAKAIDKIIDLTLDIVFEGGRCPGGANELLLTGPDAWFAEFVQANLFPPNNALPNKCVATRIKTAGKYSQAKTKCVIRDFLRPDPARLAACEVKAKEKFDKGYAKATGCSGFSSAVTIGLLQARVNQQLENIRFGNGYIQDPPNGSFSNAANLDILGGVTGAEEILDVTVNGVSQLPLDLNNLFMTNIPLDPGPIFNPVFTELTTPQGDVRIERTTYVVGDGVNTGYAADGELSPESIAFRLTEDGLNSVLPIVAESSAGALDISSFIAGGGPVLDDECVFYIGALCGYSATVNIDDVSFDDFNIAIDPRPGVTELDVIISDFQVDIDLHVEDCCAVQFDCTLEITADTTTISGNYDMQPLPSNPSKVDVNLIGDPGVSFGNFSHNFTSGLCDAPVIGDIIDGIIAGTLSDLVSDGFVDALRDPDGAGPTDNAVADGIEEALDAIDIAGPVGEAVGVIFNAEFNNIAEDENGITFSVDAGVTTEAVLPGSPDLPGSFAVNEAFPTYGLTSPSGSPYGVAVGLGSSALNQLLKGQIETGLLQATISEFDLGGGTLPLTDDLLGALVPAIDIPGEVLPIVVQIKPKLAPIFTGQPGPMGELAELQIAHLEVNLLFADTGLPVLGMVVDAGIGVDLVISPTGIGFGLGEPDPGDINIDILDNPYEANVVALQALLGTLLPSAFPALAGALDGLPLPAFFGLELQPVEVTRQGEFITIFANLAVGP